MESSPLPDEQESSARSMPFAESIEDYGTRLASLSKREWAVVELAAEGRTDEQIAQALDISVSTVNSYWVRIRGKIGPFGRVEIVAGLLRHQKRVEHAALRAENERLRDRVRGATERFHEARSAYDALTGDPWPLLALAHAPHAMFITAPPATVVYANDEARRLYGAKGGELEGRSMHELSTATTPEAVREPCRHLFEPDGPAWERVGIEDPYYARRCDGSNFRAVVEARRFDTRKGPLAVVTVREFLGDLGDVFESLRQPLPPA